MDLGETEAVLKQMDIPQKSLVDLKGMSTKGTNENLIAHALHQTFLAPNRMLYDGSLENYGLISMGYPELDVCC